MQQCQLTLCSDRPPTGAAGTAAATFTADTGVDDMGAEGNALTGGRVVGIGAAAGEWTAAGGDGGSTGVAVGSGCADGGGFAAASAPNTTPHTQHLLQQLNSSCLRTQIHHP